MSEQSASQRPQPSEGASTEHEATLNALRRMEAVVDRLQSARPRGWQLRIGSELRTVAASIRQHCLSADASGGLLTQVEQNVGRSHNVSIAHAAHEQLQQQLDALALLLARDAHVGVLRERAEEIVQALRQHLELEGDLVYDAVIEPDNGVGD